MALYLCKTYFGSQKLSIVLELPISLAQHSPRDRVVFCAQVVFSTRWHDPTGDECWASDAGSLSTMERFCERSERICACKIMFCALEKCHRSLKIKMHKYNAAHAELHLAWFSLWACSPLGLRCQDHRRSSRSHEAWWGVEMEQMSVATLIAAKKQLQ